MIQWENMKKEYIESRVSYGALAEKYGVSLKAVKARGRKEGWFQKRKAGKKESPIPESAWDRQAEDLKRVDALADEMLRKLKTAIDQLDLIVVQHKEKGETEDYKWEKTYEEAVPGGIVDRQGLRQLAACLKDLKQAKAIQSELEKQEQEARIRKLLKDGREEEAEEITVRLEGDLQDYGE